MNECNHKYTLVVVTAGINSFLKENLTVIPKDLQKLVILRHPLSCAFVSRLKMQLAVCITSPNFQLHVNRND